MFIRNTFFCTVLVVACTLLFSVPVFGQNIDNFGCPDSSFTILGPDEVKTSQTQTYTLQHPERDLSEEQYSFVQVLRAGEEELLGTVENTLTYTFSSGTLYQLRAEITSGLLDEDGNSCVYTVQKEIRQYETFLVYVGESNDIMSVVGSTGGSGTNSDILYKESLIADGATDEELYNTLAEQIGYLRYADTIIVNSNSLGKVLENIGKLFTLNEFDIKNPRVFIIDTVNQSVFRRLLSRYMTISGVKSVSTVEKQHFGSLLTTLLLGKEVQDLDYVKKFTIDLEETNKMSFLSYMTDYLLINGFPLSILILILLLPFVSLVISFLRQVVGLSVFGVFSPILFGVSIYVIGVKLSLVLLLAAFFAVMVVGQFTKYVYLLISPKVSLMFILYTIFTIVVLWSHNILGLDRVDFNFFGNGLFIFPFISVLFVAKGVFSLKVLNFKAGWLLTLGEFALVSFLVQYLLGNELLQNLFLGYPELIFVILIINILIGRFTGLQLGEYVRFYPLIKNYFEEE